MGGLSSCVISHATVLFHTPAFGDEKAGGKGRQGLVLRDSSPSRCPRWDRFLLKVNQLFLIAFPSVWVECDGLEGLRGGDVKSPIGTASYDTFKSPSRVFKSDEPPGYEALEGMAWYLPKFI
jgi:hypothetical protein